MQPTNRNRIAYLNGKWLDQSELRLSVDDLGLRQGVTAVERLRTYQKNVFMLGAHLQRWKLTTKILQIDGLPSEASMVDLIAELLHLNDSLLEDAGDVGITILATPGVVGGLVPTFAMHLNWLDHDRIEQRRKRGQPLVITNVIQQHDSTWPRSIKVRSRIHYYLADQAARDCDPDAAGVLVDADQTITETSIANLAIVESGVIVSPLDHQVLGGITQQVAERIAQSLSIEWKKDRISRERFRKAAEILCMGTDGGIWFGEVVNHGTERPRVPGEVFLRLRKMFDEQR
ncbi:D-alanine aminotransferase [Novipirellula aureliae]|uniref:D-alanine aminotransferase n=1 Tax=Novipirellula aureliae TaxID=2527966 RepID=A0A5C6DEC2_9BACT|nr:aminotransferase class IV [Novipirellula aureliae]TWU34157.1 D-alanine aminotransferase [Novipirellula aureliae]